MTGCGRSLDRSREDLPTSDGWRRRLLMARTSGGQSLGAHRGDDSPSPRTWPKSECALHRPVPATPTKHEAACLLVSRRDRQPRPARLVRLMGVGGSDARASAAARRCETESQKDIAEASHCLFDLGLISRAAAETADDCTTGASMLPTSGQPAHRTHRAARSGQVPTRCRGRHTRYGLHSAEVHRIASDRLAVMARGWCSSVPRVRLLAAVPLPLPTRRPSCRRPSCAVRGA